MFQHSGLFIFNLVRHRRYDKLSPLARLLLIVIVRVVAPTSLDTLPRVGVRVKRISHSLLLNVWLVLTRGNLSQASIQSKNRQCDF